MKIAICTNHFLPSIGGCQAVVSVLSQYFHNNGHEVFVVTRRLKGRNCSEYNFRVIEYIPGDYRSFNEKISTIKPDTLLVYSDVFDFFRQIIINDSKFRLVVAPVGFNWVYSHKNFANIIYRNVSKIAAIVCHSIHERDYKLCSTNLLQNKTVIIPNGVYLKEFDDNVLCREDLLPEHKDIRWILNISNFFPGKGHEHVVDILNRLPANENFAYIQVCSDTEFPIALQLEQNWKKNITLHLNKNIKCCFKKNISRQQVIGFLKQSNVVILTSEKEVAPLTILESMACKTPWVATDVGNIRDLSGGKFVAAVKDTRYHSIFDERVKDLFARHVVDVLHSPLIADNGRQQIERILTWDKILPKYLTLLVG